MYRGKITKPGGKAESLSKSVFCLPQKPYNCTGSLSDQITYPESKDEVTRNSSRARFDAWTYLTCCLTRVQRRCCELWGWLLKLFVLLISLCVMRPLLGGQAFAGRAAATCDGQAVLSQPKFAILTNGKLNE